MKQALARVVRHGIVIRSATRGITGEEVLPMCDFSLEGHAWRPARTGDQLVTTVLGSHNTIGMVSPDAPAAARSRELELA